MTCPCCGGSARVEQPVLWPELVSEWGLSAEEHSYIDRQQGCQCTSCGSSLRSQALALAMLRVLGVRGPLRDFLRSVRGRRLRILEINEAGHLTQFFPRCSRHHLRGYPDLDMMAMRMREGSYDLVIHSDTLEHVPDPVLALRECRRVLRPGGACCFTVPMVVGRMTRSRTGLQPSYHGRPGEHRNDFQVQTEYGADAWRQVLEAGFEECRIVTVEYPAAQALVGIKTPW